MTLTQIAIQNLRRRRGKTIFLILTFLLIAGTVVTLNVLAAGLKADLQKSLNQYGANIVITPRSEHLALTYGGLAVPGVDYEIKKLDADLPARIGQTSIAINTVAPKVVGQARQGSRSYLIIGVDFPAEMKMKPWWKLTGRAPQDNELVLGQAVARRTGLKPGDLLPLAGQNYPVAGIMQETGGSEDNGIFTTISTARALTGLTDAWSLIELNVPNPTAAATLLSSTLPQANVAEVSQLVQGSKENAERFAAYSLYISILLSGIGILVVVITLAGNVIERIRELGILRAIGFRQSHILSLLCREALLISLSGSVLGYLAGIVLPLILGPMLTQKPFEFAPHLGVGLVSLGGSVLVGVLGIAYPAWRVLRLDSAEALRYI